MLSALSASARSWPIVASGEPCSTAVGSGTAFWYSAASLLTYASPGSSCGSVKNTRLPTTFALPAASMSVTFACTSRGHGQRPMFWMLASSIATTAMRSEGVRSVARTPRS